MKRSLTGDNKKSKLIKINDLSQEINQTNLINIKNAIDNNDINAMKELIQKNQIDLNADNIEAIDASDEKKKFIYVFDPLIYSISNDKPDIVEILLQNGALLDKPRSQKPPLIIAIENNNVVMLEILIRYHISLVLPQSGYYPLQTALKINNLVIIDIIIKATFDCCAQKNRSIKEIIRLSSNYSEGLICAILNGHLNYAKLLTNYGIEINDEVIESVLKSNNIEIIRYFMLKSSGLNIIGSNIIMNNNLLVDEAQKLNKEKIREILIKKTQEYILATFQIPKDLVKIIAEYSCDSENINNKQILMEELLNNFFDTLIK